jgi:hypothetical protein
MTKTTLFTALLILLLSACQKPRYGSLTVNLKDGPAGLDEINIDLEGIEAYVENGGKGEWHKLKTNKGIYNILLFQNVSALIATHNQIPEGNVRFVRLILGENNSVLENGKYKQLLTEHSLHEKFNVLIPSECMIEADQMANILLDIDAERSITRTPSGKYKLHPVAASGVISSPLEIY